MKNSTVKTEKKAIEIISNCLAFSGLSIDDGNLEDTIVECECGETKAIRWYDSLGNCNGLLVVGICECCGDDDALESDVLEIL